MPSVSIQFASHLLHLMPTPSLAYFLCLCLTDRAEALEIGGIVFDDDGGSAYTGHTVNVSEHAQIGCYTG